MNFSTYNQINVASILKQIKLAKYTGKLETRELLLFQTIGYLLFNEIYRTFEEKQQLEQLLSKLQHSSKNICNTKTKIDTFIQLPEIVTFANIENNNYLAGNTNNNTAPVISNITVSTGIEPAYTLSQTLITSTFIDTDGDTPSLLQILSLPQYGILYYDEEPVIINQQIPVENTHLLEYQQSTNSVIDSFNFRISDNNTNPLYSNMAQFTINITNPINQPPSSVGYFALSVDNLELYQFSKADFTTNTIPQYADPELDDAYKIKITTLPIVGTLLYNGVNVVLNQEIELDLLSTIALTYVASLPQGSTGTTAGFKFSISDTGSQIFTEGGGVNITIGAYINQPPTSGSYIDNVLEGDILTITSAMLTTNTTPPYSDPEGNPPLNLKITSLPTTGLLKLNGVAVTVNQIIPFTDIDNNLLIYVQDANAGGTSVNFDFVIQDTESGQFG